MDVVDILKKVQLTKAGLILQARLAGGVVSIDQLIDLYELVEELAQELIQHGALPNKP